MAEDTTIHTMQRWYVDPDTPTLNSPLLVVVGKPSGSGLWLVVVARNGSGLGESEYTRDRGVALVCVSDKTYTEMVDNHENLTCVSLACAGASVKDFVPEYADSSQRMQRWFVDPDTPAPNNHLLAIVGRPSGSGLWLVVVARNGSGVEESEYTRGRGVAVVCVSDETYAGMVENHQDLTSVSLTCAGAKVKKFDPEWAGSSV
jgi:UDP-N-acetylglucosamine transferase subunit ALG13